MTRQNIAIGTTANDGSGDTLRSGGSKINDNFVELYQAFGVDSNYLTTGISFDSGEINIAGLNFTTTISAYDPASNVTFKLPDSNGEAVIINDNNIVDLKDSTGAASKLYYANVFDSAAGFGVLPSAATYHGMFAHNHGTGKGVMSHAGSWHNLLDSDTFTSRTSLQLINPKMDTPIFDNTGTFEILDLNNTSTGNTSYVKISNVSDSDPTIEVDGTSTNIGLNIAAKGTSPIHVDGALVYTSETLTAAADLDSGTSTYIFNIPAARSFTLHNGRYAGEIKHLINRTVEDVTIDAGANKIRRPGNTTFQNMVMSDVNFVSMIWDGFAWVVDRDSDKYITFS